MNLWAFTSLAMICSVLIIGIVFLPSILEAKKQKDNDNDCGDNCQCNN